MPTPKITRDAFLYLEPHGTGGQFAQCADCRHFNRKRECCKVLRPGDRVTAGMSCGYFAQGPNTDDLPQSWFTPEEVGLVDRQVRCQNCVSYDGKGACELYRKLNETLPHIFDLDVKVKPLACCNAQEPAPGDAARQDEARRASDRAVQRARRVSKETAPT